MPEYKVSLTLSIEALNSAEIRQKLAEVLGQYHWEIEKIAVSEDKPPVEKPQPAAEAIQQAQPVADKAQPVVQPMAQPSLDKETYATYRVADEKFRLFAKDFGITGTELKVPKNRDFLMFRVKAFLEEMGYKVEANSSVRVVAESHMEAIPPKIEAPTDQNAQLEALLEPVFVKRI